MGPLTNRNMQFDDDVFLNPKFELVLLHPNHFLPGNQTLTRYDNNNAQSYIVAEDGILRRSRESTSDAFPKLSAPQGRRAGDELNPFLVIMNAGIKFRRFQRWISEGNANTLSPQVKELIRLTLDIVEEIYRPIRA